MTGAPTLFDVELDTTELEKAWDRIGDDEIDNLRKAIGTSLARTRVGVRALAAKETRETYNVTAAQVKKNTVLTRIRRNNWSFILYGRNKTISLIHFRGKSGPPRQTKAGVSVAVQHGQRKLIRRAFIKNDIRGNKRVFSRFASGEELPQRQMLRGRHAGKTRAGIRALKGPSVADMFFDVEIDEKVADYARDRFSEEIRRNLRFFLGR